jgi:hypothetical protein
VSLNPVPFAVRALGCARVTPLLVVIVMSCGPLFVVKDDTGWSAPPVAPSELENVTVPKFDRCALLQKTNKQVSGTSAIHSAELLASLPLWVVENVHPSLLVIANV